MSRRQEKKAADKLKRAQSSTVLAHADAAVRKSRAALLHQIMRRPRHGDLTGKGAEQLRKFFSTKVPESEALSLREMDDSASMMLLQMAAEEVDAGGPSHENLRQMTEERIMANGAENGQGDEKEGKAEENMLTEEDEDWEQGGMALAKEF